MREPNSRPQPVITRDVMLTLQKTGSGGLRAVCFPIEKNARVLHDLLELSHTVQKWQSEKTDALVADIVELGVRVSYAGETSPIDAVLRYFVDAVRGFYGLARIQGGLLVDPASKHQEWGLPANLYRLSWYASYIRGFKVPPEAVRALQSDLNEWDYRNLERSYRDAVKMRGVLSPALELYERSFERYINRVDQICPGLLVRANYEKEHCTGFAGHYGTATLDYELTPGNQCVVDCIGEYYLANVLEGVYASCERDSSIVAYSHRKRGWYEPEKHIVLGDGLTLSLKTNFGYGADSYFMSTLSYRGVNAISAQRTIFYKFAVLADITGSTYNYEPEDESFRFCFNRAVQLQREFHALGEAGFVDKYFRKSLTDLSDLLVIVANTDTFLSITTLKQFEVLTEGGSSELIPDEGFRDICLALGAQDVAAVDRLAGLVAEFVLRGDLEGCKNDARVRELLRDTPALRRGYSQLQTEVNKDLVRGALIRELARFCKGANKPGDLRFSEYAQELIGPAEGFYVEKLEGYGLLQMRTAKASLVIALLGHLREIARLTQFEGVVDDLISTCALIGEQSRSYIAGALDPELARLTPERDRLREQLKELESRKSQAEHKGQKTSWFVNKIAAVELELKERNARINELSGQKGRLQEYLASLRGVTASKRG